MHIVRSYERVKFKFDKLNIGSCDLVLGEGTSITVMLYISCFFRQKWFLSFNMFILQILLYCKGQAVRREGKKTCR